MHKYPLAALAAFMLSGCVSMAPAYKRPDAPVPDGWPTGAAYEPSRSGSTAAPDIPWRSLIANEKLRTVVAQALDNSRDLRRTVANIESARAQYRVQRADLFPHLQAEGSASRSRSLNTAAAGNSTIVSESGSVGVGLSAFELDLFGKQRSLSDAALEDYLATEQGGRAARISLIAETANAYLALAADKSRLALAQKTLESAQRSMELTRKRLDAGVASGVDVRQAETIYQQARADLATLTTSIAQDRNALELLAGSGIDDSLLPDELPAADSWLTDVPEGLSSEVLLQRPDVLEAEHNLKSANADIGAARAAFFPSLTLTASGGRASSTLSSLFSGTNVWSVGSSLTAPLFNGGANVAGLAYSKAQRDLYVATYELTIQTAFKEVADALAVRGTIREQLDAQARLVEAASASYRLADARYSRGADTFLNSLDAQRTLYDAEQALVATQLTELQNTITLYRALGGGLAEGE